MKNKQGSKIIYSVLPVSIKSDLQTHCEPHLLLSSEARTEREDLGGLEKIGIQIGLEFFLDQHILTSRLFSPTQALQYSMPLLPELLGQK